MTKRRRAFRRVGVLADDFSGAGDAALAFGAAGMSAEIWTPAGGAVVLPRSRVWVIDTESRGLSPRAAARAVRRGLKTLSRWKPDFIFKKIDSTLRGPVGAELAAFLETLAPEGPVAVVPAFPRMKRTTVGGRHFVDGVPLSRTVFRRDPRHPVRSDRVATVLSLPPVLAKRTWIPDVENERDLGSAARRALTGSAAVGSAGFALAIARAMGKRRAVQLRWRAIPVGGPPRVGVVVGSAHPASGRQGDRLKNFLPRAGVFLLERPLRRGSPGRVLSRLVDGTRRLEKERGIRRWVVTGGETAFALARLWKTPRWRVVGSVEPGVPLCRSLGPRSRWLVMKPGGFGSDRVFVKAVRRLTAKDG